MVAQNCTAQPISAISTWFGRFLGSGTGIPPGCTVIDPVAFPADFAANGQVTRSLGFFTFAGCTATAMQITVTISAGGTQLASQTATLQLAGASTSTSPAPCAVNYSRQSEWSGGFVASVTITNTGTGAINGWTLAFTFPGDQKITNAWNAAVTQTGAAVSAVNVSYNKLIAAGASTNFGFQGTWRTSDASPTSFTLNGVACATR
jgi:cellulase/cellobiase CelA1